MKLSPKGFTLVELMIVIAIIGILAAALFPSLTSYLARGRDTSRAAGIKEISTAVAAYNVDKSSFPAGTAAGSPSCASSGNITAAYMPKMPVDPTKSSANCGTPGLYGYGTGTANGTTTVLLSATFENANGGNSLSGASIYQGDNVSAGAIA